MINAEQETAAMHAPFWIACAQEALLEGNTQEAESHMQRAIKNLMIASHGR